MKCRIDTTKNYATNLISRHGSRYRGLESKASEQIVDNSLQVKKNGNLHTDS